MDQTRRWDSGRGEVDVEKESGCPSNKYGTCEGGLNNEVDILVG